MHIKNQQQINRQCRRSRYCYADDLLEYSDNYSMKSGSLWNYYRNENVDANESNAAKYRISNKKTTTSKSFEYKRKIIGRTRSRNND